jgi:uncharacterized protein (DUF58 family)
VRIRPVIRPSLVLLLLLCLASAALPGLNVTLPLLALLVSLLVNVAFAVRHVASADITLATPPIGRAGGLMNWTVTTPESKTSLGGWLLVGASLKNRVPVVPGRNTTLPVILDQRGIYSVAQLNLISTGPLFLPLHAGRKVTRQLVMPLVVAPRMNEVPQLLAAVVSVRSVAEGEMIDGGDIPGGPKSIRPFERGDRISAVHWPATARTGAIHVKELERLGGSNAITVVVDHIDGSARGEAMLSEATWLIHQLLRADIKVDLATSTFRTAVNSAVQADELLALVAPGEFVGSTGTRDHSQLGTVRVQGSHWTVEGKSVCPAGLQSESVQPSPIASSQNIVGIPVLGSSVGLTSVAATSAAATSATPAPVASSGVHR